MGGRGVCSGSGPTFWTWTKSATCHRTYGAGCMTSCGGRWPAAGLYLVTWEPEYLSGPPPRCPRVLEDEPVVECSAGCHHARARAMRVMGITPNPIPLYDTVLSLLDALSEAPAGGWSPL